MYIGRLLSALLLMLLLGAGFVAVLVHCTPEPLPPPVVLPPPAPEETPEETPEQIAERKRLFIDLLLPVIQEENRRLLRLRTRLDRVDAELSAEDDISREDFLWLKQLAAEFDLDPAARRNPEFFGSLRARVDTLPASLVIAQAALESGWGRARASRDGNNFFGHYCFAPECGTPAPGPGDLRQFPSPRESVRAYMQNLNSHQAYTSLRRQRQQLRNAGKPVTGSALVSGLHRYSERGEAYVADVLQLIRDNDLDALPDR